MSEWANKWRNERMILTDTSDVDIDEWWLTQMDSAQLALFGLCSQFDGFFWSMWLLWLVKVVNFNFWVLTCKVALLYGQNIQLF